MYSFLGPYINSCDEAEAPVRRKSESAARARAFCFCRVCPDCRQPGPAPTGSCDELRFSTEMPIAASVRISTGLARTGGPDRRLLGLSALPPSCDHRHTGAHTYERACVGERRLACVRACVRAHLLACAFAGVRMCVRARARAGARVRARARACVSRRMLSTPPSPLPLPSPPLASYVRARARGRIRVAC